MDGIRFFMVRLFCFMWKWIVLMGFGGLIGKCFVL